MHEPRDPPLKVVSLLKINIFFFSFHIGLKKKWFKLKKKKKEILENKTAGSSHNKMQNYQNQLIKKNRNFFLILHKVGWYKVFGCGNDPSAGSPTETLLRLLLPLNDQV